MSAPAALGSIAMLLLSMGGGAPGRPALPGDGATGRTLQESGPGDPDQIPLLAGFSTPVLAPGESGTLNFSIRNRYSDATVRDPVVSVEVYKYATRDAALPVSGSSADAPAICIEARPREQCTTSDRVGGFPDLLPGSFPFHAVFDVHTSSTTPHGSQFDASAYFVRISLEFIHSRTVGSVVMDTSYKLISRGFITDADWEEANKGPSFDMKIISERYSNPALPYDEVIGIVPETSFTLREPFALWPLALVLGLAALTGGLGIMLWMHESRRSFPWLRAAIDRGVGKVRKRVPPRKKVRVAIGS